MAMAALACWWGDAGVTAQDKFVDVGAVSLTHRQTWLGGGSGTKAGCCFILVTICLTVLLLLLWPCGMLRCRA